jgi:hypothetical protein
LNFDFDIVEFFVLKVPLWKKWDSECSSFELRDSGFSKLLCASRSRVSLDLLKAHVTGHRGDLVCCRPGLG